jgi:hypothetical protein
MKQGMDGLIRALGEQAGRTQEAPATVSGRSPRTNHVKRSP